MLRDSVLISFDINVIILVQRKHVCIDDIFKFHLLISIFQIILIFLRHFLSRLKAISEERKQFSLPCGVFDGFDVVARDGPGFTSCGAVDSVSSTS